MEQIADYKLLLDTAVMAGKIMLKNGAEIYRVEDTIYRMLKVSNLKTTEAYVIATGFIVTLDDPNMDSLTVVKRIKERKLDLNKISIVNTVSRRFCAGEMTLKEAFHELKHIEKKQYSSTVYAAAMIIAVASFVILLGGSLEETIGAVLEGALLLFITKVGERVGFNPFIQDMAASTLVAIGATLIARYSGVIMNMDILIIGGIMPLLPGAAITNAIRDTLQGDYLAGNAKVMEAFVKAVAIAMGVAIGIYLTGGY